MIVDYKLIAALLDYPMQLSCEIIENISQLLDQCSLMKAEDKDNIREFVSAYANMPLLNWQQSYCDTFDIAPTTSLYLFEHVHGDSSKRGGALCSLKMLYQDHGLEISNKEQPDYLPVFLDFLSSLPEDEAAEYIKDILPILNRMHMQLSDSKSPYALLIKSITNLNATSR